MKKVTVRLDDHLHRRLRLRSVESEESVQAMLMRLLMRELQRDSRRRPKEVR